ncbi:hypothetical protein C7J88_00585 [Staphylococcus muscae]|uniref:Uncharacterized protein n=1 Tax=Staphylococcus muscae TaxID=1294 RepID=A0A240C0Y7_9STAP|nr:MULTISPECIES: hypothetical protein [Staphylococcus]AVQ32770.1 hypothetical protein C7J88_00585 [Staphylococcus muscae]PNZ05316.1 hypothetical protein CD131_02330 [Staphylococcus muscae]UXR79008.1 hypothetical protein MUA92_03720 [Staphylococcus sp. IVB6227]UXR83167.1 hypothetical protein MUA51_03690 [Staphylococcus sp. IVB6214]SNW01585.1 Uncharacterised protein [Staphylococcus muscae]
MDDKKNILVIKLSKEHDESDKALKDRVTGKWKISPKRLDDVEFVVVLILQEVVATYRLGDEFKYNRSTGRVEDLELIEDDTYQKYIGQFVDYKTSNPATLSSESNLFAQ